MVLLARNPAQFQHPQRALIQLVPGSLENMAQWQDQLLGIDVVVHMAAPVVFWAPWQLYEENIVSATGRLLEASA